MKVSDFEANILDILNESTTIGPGVLRAEVKAAISEVESRWDLPSNKRASFWITSGAIELSLTNTIFIPENTKRVVEIIVSDKMGKPIAKLKELPVERRTIEDFSTPDEIAAAVPVTPEFYRIEGFWPDNSAAALFGTVASQSLRDIFSVTISPTPFQLLDYTITSYQNTDLRSLEDSTDLSVLDEYYGVIFAKSILNIEPYIREDALISRYKMKFDTWADILATKSHNLMNTGDYAIDTGQTMTYTGEV